MEKPICTKTKPATGRLECNCDRCGGEEGVIGMGFMVRDANGEVLLVVKGEATRF